MILTYGTYNFKTGKFNINSVDVEEKEKIYKGKYVFRKDEEEKVRTLQSSAGYSYLEVYTTNTDRPVETLQRLVSDWFQDRAYTLQKRTFGIFDCYESFVKDYIQSMDVEDVGVNKADLLDEDCLFEIVSEVRENNYLPLSTRIKEEVDNMIEILKERNGVSLD